MIRALALVLAGLVGLGATAAAGTIGGKLELPPAPERPPLAVRGFLDRLDNPLAPVREPSVTPQIVVVLDGGDTPVSPPQITWELPGDSFARPVIAAPTGAEVVIKAMPWGGTHTLVAQEDPKLVPAGPINPGATKSFRVTEAGKLYTIVDKETPWLVGRLVVVGSQLVGYPDESGHFEIADVPPGSYKVRVWYRDGWIAGAESEVTLPAKGKGKTEVNLKIPAGAFAPAKK